jgi:Tfp pilus assembly protein FimT
MIVVALIGIMTAMILPEMKGTYEEALLRSTSRDLVSAVNMASSRAISFNQPYRIRLDRGAGQYRVEKRVRAGGREEFVPLNDLAGSDGKLDPRITIEIRQPDDAQSEEQASPLISEASVSEEVITFFPDGTADAKEVRLQDRQGFRLALRINPTTARVRIVELARQ